MGPEQPRAAIQGIYPDRPWTEGVEIGEINAQDAALARWSEENGRFISPDALRRLTSQAVRTATGSEHTVLLTGDSAIRMTKLNMFGFPFRSPAQYLRRWELSNQLFPNVKVSFEGYAKDPLGNGIIITRQPLVDAQIGSRGQIAEFFGKHGFHPMKGMDYAYINDKTGVEIYDAHGGNVLFDKSGNAYPIDVWVVDRRGAMR